MNRLLQITIAFLLCTGAAWGDSLRMPITAAETKDAWGPSGGASDRPLNAGTAIDLRIERSNDGSQRNTGFWLSWLGMVDSLDARAPGGWTVDSVVDSLSSDGAGNSTTAGETMYFSFKPIKSGFTWKEGVGDAQTGADSAKYDSSSSYTYRKWDTAAWSGSLGTAFKLDSIVGGGYNDDAAVWHKYTYYPTTADSLIRNYEGLAVTADSGSAATTMEFDSSEGGDKPRRWIYYTVTAAPSTTLVIGPPR